jgi:hypothetical protein
MVAANRAFQYGGALFGEGGALAELVNVTLSNDSAQSYRAAYFSNWQELTVVNTIIWNCRGRGSVLASSADCRVTVHHSDIDSGQEAFYMAGDGELVWGEGNLDQDPLFYDADAGDYRLPEASPCVDAGDPDSPPDPDSSRADIGALPYYHTRTLLLGRVRDSVTRQPLDSAMVIADYGPVARTNREGLWSIREARINGPFSLTASYAGFIDSTRQNIHLELGDTLTVDFGLLRPVFDPTPSEVLDEVAPDSSVEVGLSVRNDGNWPLNWQVHRSSRGEPNEPWSVTDRINLSPIVGNFRVLGAVFAEEELFITAGGGDTNYVYVLSRDGQFQRRFPQFTESM